MYIPKAFEQTDIAALHDFMRVRRFGTIVTVTSDGLVANHIPFVLEPEPAPFGMLRGHVARANPLWRDYSSDIEALAIVSGDDAYISPTWYPTKRETAKVVPTWNYMVVHAYGHLRFVDDPVWVRAHLEALTDQQEVGRLPRWYVSDAPSEFIERIAQGVVGLELPISRLEGKWKLSQNRGPADRAGAIEGLRSEGTQAASRIADAMLRLRAPE